MRQDIFYILLYCLLVISCSNNTSRVPWAVRKWQREHRVPEKIIKYLWDDAFEFNREIVFETTNYQSLEQIIRVFLYSKGVQRFAMFKENVRNAFIDTDQ